MARLVAASGAILCAVVTITSFEAIARAERRPVAVIELVDDEDAHKLGNELREALTAHTELKPLVDASIPALLTQELLDEDRELLVGARAFKDNAEDALARFDYSVAANNAISGLDVLYRATPTTEPVQLASDLAFIYAQAKLGDNDPKEAARWFGFVHRLTPNRRVDPSHFLPEVVAAYTQAKPMQQPPGALEVHGSRGHVYIDGIDVGVPNATFEVAPGLHLIQITGPERQPRGARFDVPIARPGAAAASVAIEDFPTIPDQIASLKIRRARLALSRATDPVARSQAIKNLAVLLHVSDAILILRINGKLVAQAWRDHMPKFDAPIFDKPIDAATAKPVDMLAWLAPPRALQPFDGRDKLPPHEPAWYEKRWVQASAVSTLIVVVLAGYLYSQRGGGMNPVDSTIHTGMP